jgi:hypothetical protein
MRRVIAVVSGVLLVTVFLGVGSSAAQTTEKDKVVTAQGTVSAVSDNSLTVKGKSAELTFSVDSKTDVVGKGLGTKETQLKEEKKSPRLTDFVKVGDEVSVSYNESSKLATRVRVTKSALPAK